MIVLQCTIQITVMGISRQVSEILWRILHRYTEKKASDDCSKACSPSNNADLDANPENTAVSLPLDETEKNNIKFGANP